MDFQRLYNSKDERTQLVKRNVIGGFGVRGISILASLILVPLTINYISSELYGIWLTLSSIIHWISFFDIGFGNGLRNKLAESIALEDYKKGKIYVSTTYAVLILIFVSIGFLSYFGAGYINWSSFLKVSEDYNPVLIRVSQILLVAFCLQMILKLIQNISQAYQLNALASLLDALGNVFSLLFIYILTLTMAPSLPLIAIVFGFSPLLVLLGASIILFLGRFKQVSPNVYYVNFKYAQDIFKLGGSFFLLQMATIVLYQMVNILISRMCGPEQVTNYNVSYKYLSILLMVITIVISPLWSAFTDAYVRNDYIWMSSVYDKLMKMFIISVLCLVLMVIISPFVYYYWIGDEVSISFSTSVLVGLYVLILIWGSIHSYLLNGMGKVRLQLYIGVISMICFLPLAIVMGGVWNINGILSAMVVINVPGSMTNAIQVKMLIANNANGIWVK